MKRPKNVSTVSDTQPSGKSRKVEDFSDISVIREPVSDFSDAAKKEKRMWRKSTLKKNQSVSGDVDHRFTKSRLVNRKKLWLSAACCLVCLGVFVWFGVFSQAFSVSEIRVDGTQRVDSKLVRAALDPQLGRPLGQVSEQDVQNILADFQIIQSFRLERIPPHLLVVRVVERVPIGYVRKNAQFDLVDGAGVSIQSFPTVPEDFPEILGTTGDALLEAGFVLRSIPVSLHSTVVSVSAESSDSVTLRLDSGARVVWGNRYHSELKQKVLKKLMEVSASKKVLEFDVSSPHNPAFRF